MQLDFQQFLIKLEKITDLRLVYFLSLSLLMVEVEPKQQTAAENWQRPRAHVTAKRLNILWASLLHFRPIPDREYVDAYIKAYYLPDDKLDIWIREHKVRSLWNGLAIFT